MPLAQGLLPSARRMASVTCCARERGIVITHDLQYLIAMQNLRCNEHRRLIAAMWR